MAHRGFAVDHSLVHVTSSMCPHPSTFGATASAPPRESRSDQRAKLLRARDIGSIAGSLMKLGSGRGPRSGPSRVSRPATAPLECSRRPADRSLDRGRHHSGVVPKPPTDIQPAVCAIAEDGSGGCYCRPEKPPKPSGIAGVGNKLTRVRQSEPRGRSPALHETTSRRRS